MPTRIPSTAAGPSGNAALIAHSPSGGCRASTDNPRGRARHGRDRRPPSPARDALRPRLAWERPPLLDRFVEHQLVRVAHRRGAIGQDLVVVGLEVEAVAKLFLHRTTQVELLLHADEIRGQL